MPRYPYYGYLVYFRQYCQLFYAVRYQQWFCSTAAKAATAAWLLVQIVICSFTSLFLRQLVTQSSIPATSAWKASILLQWDVPLYFALIFANLCPSPLLIKGSICEPDMLFSQPFGPVFVSLFPGRYHYTVFTEFLKKYSQIFFKISSN